MAISRGSSLMRDRASRISGAILALFVLLAWPLPGWSQVKPAPAVALQTPEWFSRVGISRQTRLYTEDLTRLYPGGFGLSSWSSWIRTEDMPSELRSKEFLSYSFVSLELDETGKPADCKVLKPSSDPRLDELGCRKLLQNAKFEPFYSAPAHPIRQRINVSLTWETIARATWQKRGGNFLPPAVAPPRPLTSFPQYQGWPRLRWTGNLQIDQFPDLNNLSPRPSPRQKSGTTGLELEVRSDVGVVQCTVLKPSGDTTLDQQSCDIARSLHLSYTAPCDECGSQTLPLQFVWQNRKSHIRVPLAAEDTQNGLHRSDSMPRDPADTRPAQSRARLPVALQRPALSVSDFSDIAERAQSKSYASISLTVGPDGRVIGCKPMISTSVSSVDAQLCALSSRQMRFSKPTDIFGDPATATAEAYFNLTGMF
jgi:outer membrane biosynthesis protein TonB